MPHPNEDIARRAIDALVAGDVDGFLAEHTDDVVIHFPGRGPMAGEHRGKEFFVHVFQRQMAMLDAPPRVEVHDVLANDEHAVALNKVVGTTGGRTLEQEQVVVMHLRDGKIAEVWLHFSKQQEMDEMMGS